MLYSLLAMTEAERILNEQVDLIMTAKHVGETFKHHDYSEKSQIPFKSIEFLGRGAYGYVDKVERISGQSRGREYARKVFMMNVDRRRRNAILISFQNEVDIIKSVWHPHIICVIETYMCKNQFAIIMTPVAEENLHEFLDRVDDTPLNSGLRERIPPWFGCLASGTAYLHAEGIRHRDIKPSNILVVAEKDIFLTDFGISVELPEDTNLTTTENLGTPMYRAPEAANMKRSGRPADIFALGAVFLEMLTVHSGHKQLERFIDSRRSDNGRYASNVDEVFGWMNYLGNMRHIDPWHSSILFLCRNMLQMERDQRPKADALMLCWSYLPFSAVPPTFCECSPFPNDFEKDSIEGINKALQKASGSGHKLMVGLLIERGAAINNSDALSVASAGGFEDIAQILLEKGANIEAKDNPWMDCNTCGSQAWP
jgi:serine/threonine protein kinase